MDARRIARIRRARGYTQEQLAELTGVHPMTVSRWERGVLEPGPHARALIESLEPGRGASARAERLAGILNEAFIEVTDLGTMQISASNQFRGKVVQIEEGPVSTRVVVRIAPKVDITSVITTASSRRLGLKVGKAAVAIIKATEVIVGVDEAGRK